MSGDLIRQTAERLFGQRPPSDAKWEEMAELGFPLALLSEEDGGFGLQTAEALEILIAAGRVGCGLPLAEAMLGNWILARCQQAPASGKIVVVADRASPVHLPDDATDVLMARADGSYLRKAASACAFAPFTALSGERMARLAGAEEGGEPGLTPGVGRDQIRAMAALLRAALIAGALEGAVELSVQYAAERVQFGRPLSKLQVIQQYLAQMAGQAAAARAGVTMAAAAADLGDGAAFAALAAAAKIRAGEAVGPVADLAHQIHGAIGFSEEYPLHHLTRRLWLWRELDGTEADWADYLGGVLMQDKKRGLWAQLTVLQGGIF